MKILITRAKGFIGKNLTNELHKRDYTEISEFDIRSKPELLDVYCSECDFVYHLAGVNRPKDESEYMTGNFGFASTLLEKLGKYHNVCPIMIASSIQATMDNPYGISKKAAEDLMLSHHKETGAQVFIYRFPNIFGKGCRPDYNSAVATFCHHIANDLPIKVKDRNVMMKLVYIDDLVEELIPLIDGRGHKKEDGFYFTQEEYTISLGEIVDLIYFFKEAREKSIITNIADPFTRKLYATYLSYLPKNN